MTNYEMIKSSAYKQAFSEWRKLHKYRHNTGNMGKRYIEAHRKLNAITTNK